MFRMAQRLYHKRSEYNPEGIIRRTVYVDDKQLCQLTGHTNGAWSFSIDWTGYDGTVTSSSLKGAEELIRALLDTFGINRRHL